ncbi:hypothetical protein DH2020_021132 [Rehmannia glutinosa]|uniref:Ring/U-Box superfamily protein n=1 Tax=Rehmannia glutinosa TaxID=99300 RepID=A0ABR0WDD4_REHGL
MAVAGLHNVSAFRPSFFGDSQSRWDDDDHGRPSPRASTLLQMWRELEGRQQRNGSDTECSSTPKSVDNGDNISQHSDESENNSVISEQSSSDLGEIERERVRQIFREWMNCGSKGQSSYGFRLNNRSGQWLGENECERVRIVREWVHMSTQERKDSGSLGDAVVRVGSQIEQVREGLVINRPEIGARRPIRRLCGRQTLLDLLLRAQSETKRELLGLAEQRPVSGFAHRNRIQALLRGRFLRNERMAVDERPSSRGATELGLLRQRHTVSDLREGFLSKLENAASTSVNGAEADSSSIDENHGESESTCREGEVTVIRTSSDLESGADGNSNTQELAVQVNEADDPVLYDEIHDQEVPHGFGSASSREEPALDTEDATIANESSLESDDINYSASCEVFNENYESRSGASCVSEADDHTDDLEFHSRDASAQVEEFQGSVIEIEDSAWREQNTEDTSRSWQENSAYRSFPEPFDNNVNEQEQMQESHEDWPSHDLQEAIDSWLDMPSGEVGTSFGRIDTYYPPDDDNVHSIELRELFSRRRVSSLLRSSFRESLDQVLQSHAERLGHASGDWELDNTSSFPLLEQDQEELNGDQTLALSDGAERNPFATSSTLFAAAQPPLWDEELLGERWSHRNSNLQLETWEVINELRIDLARLQQRMNNMQSMLEACMEMQLELQRSVRQEVSAALNRSNFSRDEGASEDNLLCDESQWDHVRKGICCLCRDSKIDSLLYR